MKTKSKDPSSNSRSMTSAQQYEALLKWAVAPRFSLRNF